MLEIIYKEGRGRLTIDLEKLLPCNAADFKRLLSFVDLSARPWEHAETIYNHIAEKVADLKKARADYNPDVDKKAIADINATIKKYSNNAAALAKNNGTPEISADDEKTVMHAATVFGRIYDAGKGTATAKAFAGWTFEKGGFTFDVRKDDRAKKAVYVVMLHGTGMQVATTTKRTAAPDEITPRILETISGSPEKIRTYCRQFEDLMIAAGLMDPEERHEIISDNEQEEDKMNTFETAQHDIENGAVSRFSFAPDSVTVNGETFEAEYNISPTGSVLVFAIVGSKPDGRKEKARLFIKAGSPLYEAAYKAATGAAFEGVHVIDTATGETVTENAAETIEAEADTSETIQADPEPVRDPKQARGSIPEKTFIGETIQGKGWRIFFDGEKERTRVIFEKIPAENIRETLKKAGFYWSPVMKSWNKKLTFKAYRAAVALSGELTALYAA